jgi:DsbC/DsbD-like thiol-disulfide interchange protein
MTHKSEVRCRFAIHVLSIVSLLFGFNSVIVAQDFQAPSVNSQQNAADQIAQQQAEALQQSMFKPMRMPQQESNFGNVSGVHANAAKKNPGQSPQSEIEKPKDPWQMTGRIHIEQGTSQGYLVLQVDLADNHYIYSVAPKQSPAPTQLKVAPSSSFRMLANFSPDTAPIVIEKDPVFEQRIEKHKGTVQFFAPIKLEDGVNLATINAEVVFIGQVCSEEGFCIPLRGNKVVAQFAGYFDRAQQGDQNQATQRATQQVDGSGVRR